MIGRGSSDMKGGLAAIIHAARPAAEAGARIGLVIVPDEETGGRLGAERLAGLGRLDRSAAGAIVAEPTWGTIWHACRGAFTLRVRVRGRPAHVGLHYEGVNAFAGAVEVAASLGELEQALRERRSALEFASPSDRARESIMLVGGVSGGGTNFNIVPAGVQLHDRSPAEPRGELRRGQAGAPRPARLSQRPRCGARLGGPPGRAERGHARGRRLRPGGRGGGHGGDRLGADASRAAPACSRRASTTSWGSRPSPSDPGVIERMHGPDEDVPIANLVDAAAIYTEVAGALALASAHGR